MELPAQQSVAALRRFTRPRERVERCELCAVALPPEHQHLVEPATRRLLCACEACAILFSNDAETKYRRVPRRGRQLSDFHMSDAQWNALLVPIGLAFFFYNSPAGRVVAVYPSPAGPTESLLELEAWEDIASDNPVLREMAPDVEALLVNRIDAARDYFLAPIDQCYQLCGLLRLHWQGLSGGDAVWREIDQFFEALRRSS
ncbi:MAG: hypothetical protein KY475_05450 [Planctomycetes bacterium]|nr:hypothetical protein [Planctomycetota bacterium]